MWSSTRICSLTTFIYLYINDLPKISNNFKPNLFADDTNLILYDKTILNLKDKMKQI